MKKMLLISAHYPSPNARFAGHKTAYMFLEEYSKEYEIDLIVLCNGDEIDKENISKLTNVNLLNTVILNKYQKIKNIISSKTIFPLKVNTRFNISIFKYLKQNISKYDTLYFEFTHAAVFLPKLKKDIKQNQNVIISSHDVLFQNSYRDYEKSNSLLSLFDSKVTYLFEKEIYTMATQIIVQSSKDKNLVELLYNVKDKVIVKAPALSSFVQKVKELRKDELVEKKSLLFWGAMNREENELAVLKFLELYHDLLIQENYKLYIVGNKPSQKILNLASSNIIVTGFVEDPSEYFIKAELGIVPLVSGAGIKVKTLEMLECGMKVISTPIGAEGITDDKLIISKLENFWKYL
jgi:glycosyltransferase involved in cell wall biosynthesis